MLDGIHGISLCNVPSRENACMDSGRFFFCNFFGVLDCFSPLLPLSLDPDCVECVSTLSDDRRRDSGSRMNELRQDFGLNSGFLCGTGSVWEWTNGGARYG